MFIFGEPGLEKDEAAALVHFGSRDRREPMARVDCERAGDGLAADLFGAGSRPGLLEWLGAGTLLLNNVHRVRLSILCTRNSHVVHFQHQEHADRGAIHLGVLYNPHAAGILLSSKRVWPCDGLGRPEHVLSCAVMHNAC